VASMPLHKALAGQVSAAAACRAPDRCGLIERYGPSPAAANADSPLEAFRVPATDLRRILAWERAWTQQRRAAGLGGVTALALSGGGANGAFGAGVVVGWTRSGCRPSFDVVTGVSTGALIAPFVFAGPEWDARLTAAYHDQRLCGLIDGRLSALIGPSLGVLFRRSLVSAAPLIRLVEDYADEALLAAIAAKHDSGRRLLVATTNLDTQDCVFWDLGAIAKASLRADDDGRSLRLFRTVLVASASVPGLFPPTRISFGDRLPIETHIDGCVSTPLFLAPGWMTGWRPDACMRPTELYLIVNANLEPACRAARRGALPTMLRALDTMSRAGVRATIAAVELLTHRHGATVACAAIRDDRPAHPFNFKSANLRDLFDLGRTEAMNGQAFRPAARSPWREVDPLVRTQAA